MNAPDPLIQRITDRLATDPELRLEVARELQGHLEDCAAEFRSGGAGEAEARASAEKALGDPAELSDQLWRANRGRMRFRAVARWTASLALLPAAIVTAAIIGMNVTGFPGGDRFSLVEELWTEASAHADGNFVREATPHGLSGDKLFILRGDANARLPAEREKAISDRWPDDPVYYGNYVQTLMGDQSNGFYARWDPNEGPLAELLAILRRGETLDPENAFYNLHEAFCLLKASSTLDEKEPDTKVVQDANAPAESTWDLRITDANLFHRGLEEYRRASAKGRYFNRAAEMVHLRLGLFPQPESLGDAIARNLYAETSTGGAWMAAWGQCRQITRIICAYAVRLAKAGDPAALTWVRTAREMGDKIGSQEPTIIGELVALSMRSLAIGTEEEVARTLGMNELADRAAAEGKQGEQFFKGFGVTRPAMEHAGYWWSMNIGAMPGRAELNFEPARTGEAFLVFQVGLLLLLAAFSLLGAALWAMALWSKVRHSKDRRGILLFIGWPRLGSVCLWSVILPLGAFALYSYWQFSRAAAYGLNYAWERIVVEMVGAAALMLLVLVGASYRAARRRAVEIGLEVPEPIRVRRRPVVTALGLIVLAMVLVYVIGWWAGLFRPGQHPRPLSPEEVERYLASQQQQPLPIGLILAGIVAGLSLFWLLREFIGLTRQGRFAIFRRTLTRSLIPIVCSAVILLGVACGLALSLGERSAAGRIKGDAWMDISNEFERTGFREVHQRFIEWSEQDRMEAGGNPMPDAQARSTLPSSNP
jgi:hypothetical protein